MRPHAPRRSHWVQFGIYGGVLLLPPLALGVAFYSMLAPSDDEAFSPAGVEAAGGANVRSSALTGVPATVAEGQVAAGNRGSWDPQAPVQGVPSQVTVDPGTAVAAPANAQAAAAPVHAESPPATAAPPKRAHRNGQRHQQPTYPLKNFLQNIGILPRNSRG